jgi:hypothetical protein
MRQLRHHRTRAETRVDREPGPRRQQSRLAESGLAAVEERGTTCCYAMQDKFWVHGAPDRERWGIYTVLADSPTFAGQTSDDVTSRCGNQLSTAAAAGAAWLLVDRYRSTSSPVTG